MKLFVIVKERAYDNKIIEIAKTFQRLHEMELAIDWAIARAPKSFFNIKENYYLWKTDKFSEEFPQLIILYKVNEELETCTLLTVELVSNIERFIASLN